MSKEAYVNIEISGGVGEITFFHPAHNALPSNILKKLTGTIVEAGKSPDIKVIVLRSGGDRTFCAGASFNELVSINEFEAGKNFFMGFANVINACRKCSKLIIGRVQGKAVGGGVGLVAATDYCFATQQASIKLSELSIGIGPFVVGPAVERKIGNSAFSSLAINATEFQTAQWAMQHGLYHAVFDSTDLMDQSISHLVDNLLNSSMPAMQHIKKILWEGTDHWDQLLEERAAISGELVLSEETKTELDRYKATK